MSANMSEAILDEKLVFCNWLLKSNLDTPWYKRDCENFEYEYCRSFNPSQNKASKEIDLAVIKFVFTQYYSSSVLPSISTDENFLLVRSSVFEGFKNELTIMPMFQSFLDDLIQQPRVISKMVFTNDSLCVIYGFVALRGPENSNWHGSVGNGVLKVPAVKISANDTSKPTRNTESQSVERKESSELVKSSTNSMNEKAVSVSSQPLLFSSKNDNGENNSSASSNNENKTRAEHTYYVFNNSYLLDKEFFVKPGLCHVADLKVHLNAQKTVTFGLMPILDRLVNEYPISADQYQTIVDHKERYKQLEPDESPTAELIDNVLDALETETSQKERSEKLKMKTVS